MLFLERFDVTAVRRHMKNHEDGLRTNPNSALIRQAVSNISHSVDPSGSRMREMPLPTITGISQRGTPVSRDADFDAAVERFIIWYYEQCDLIEAWQQKQNANAKLDRQVLRENVLRYAIERDEKLQNEPGRYGDEQSMGEIQEEMFLSQRQILDAVEYLSSQGAIEIVNEWSTGDGVETKNVRVTSHGRDLAERVTPAFSRPLSSGPTINNYGPSAQQFGPSSVANIASSINIDRRSIHQVINEVRARIADFPTERREEVAVYADDLAEEIERPEPRAARLRTIVGNIARVSGEASLHVITALTAGVIEGLSS